MGEWWVYDAEAESSVGFHKWEIAGCFISWNIILKWMMTGHACIFRHLPQETYCGCSGLFHSVMRELRDLWDIIHKYTYIYIYVSIILLILIYIYTMTYGSFNGRHDELRALHSCVFCEANISPLHMPWESHVATPESFMVCVGKEWRSHRKIMQGGAPPVRTGLSY